MTVESAVPLSFGLGDKITVFASTYTLNALPKLLKGGKRRFTYDITWEGRLYDLLRAICFDEDDSGVSISSDFSLTGNLSTFMGVIINNLERVYGAGTWVLGDCPETDYLTLTFSNENCLAALQRLCGEDTFNKEFEITEVAGVCTIDIKDAIGQNLAHTYEYGKGKGLFNLTRETVSNKNIITRLYAFGANKNLASDYRGFSQRLKLPLNDLSYIEDAAAKTAFGHIEGVKTFEDIFPHRTGTVSSLGASVYQFIDSGMDFDLNATDENGTIYLISGIAAKIHFNTGNLAGYEFEITSYNHTTKTFAIKAFLDERGQIFPDPDTSAFQIAAGDKYVILDIILPQSYIDTAESDLQIAAEAYLSQNSQPRVQYSLTIDELYLIGYYPGETIVNVYNVGDYLPIKDTDIDVDKSIRVKSFGRDILRHYRYTLSLSDIVETSILQRMIADSIETQKVIALNKLNDVARARRSWQSTRELLDMIFDTDGYFDGTNIKPESIETGMINVGSRSAQLSLNCKIEPNYTGDPAKVNISSGTLSHYGIADTIKDWAIDAALITLANTNAWYIYGKCEKAGSSGTILLSQSQIKVNDDANYYHFLLGILHSVEDNVRWISLTFGSTSINGKFIKTGKISSQDTLTYFDLDTGEIGGKIKFQSGKYDTEVESDISTAATAAATADGKAVTADGKAVTAQNAAATADGKAVTAQGTANLKGRLFASQPTTPYKVGDLWSTGTNLYKCKIERLTGSYVSADWDFATNYDRTETIIDGGLITTGRIEVGNKTGGNAGINGYVSATPDDDIRFWAGASYANRATLAPFRVTNKGALVAKGVSEFGTETINQGGYLGALAIKGNFLWENSIDNDSASILINYWGFAGGTTRYRNMIIGNGRGQNIIFCDGATRLTYLSGPLTVLGPVNMASSPSIYLGGAHNIATGTSDITCTVAEADMTNMSITLTPKGDKLFIIFSAPFNVSAYSQAVTLYINVGGSNVRKMTSSIYTQFQGVAFQHIASVTPNSSVTVKIRWSGSTSIQQRGSTDSERILTVIDLM